MKPFTTHTGIAVPLAISNIDTDQIIPKQFLKRIERSGFGQFLFYDWRYNRDGSLNDDFILNSKRYHSASILISHDNFGCGSSREHAPWALLDYGIKVIIAKSFADIFYSNCFKNGLLPIQLEEDQIQTLLNSSKQDGYQLTVNLEDQTITDENGLLYEFETDPYRRKLLIEGLDDIGVTETYESFILQYEKNRVTGY